MKNPDSSSSRYWRYFLMVEQGDDPLHEWIHLWQHAGTTFGAFELIGFHITAKAMNRAFRSLYAKGYQELPYGPDTLRQLPEEAPDERKELERALQYYDLMRAYEGDDRIGAGHEGSAGWYVGSPPASPTVIPDKGPPVLITVTQVKEFHNHILKRLGAPISSGPIEERLYDAVTQVAGLQNDRYLAYLCDWALMSPNPKWIEFTREEVRPAWRFIRGLESLRASNTAPPNLSYTDFCGRLAESLGWNPPGNVEEQFPKFVEQAEYGAENVKDSKRARRMYGAIARRLRVAHQIRRESPSAFALPHEHEDLLRDRLQPLAYKGDAQFTFPGDETSGWYFPYMHNVVSALAAFTRTKICCSYKYFDMEPSCPWLGSEKSIGDCLTLPETARTKWIKCGFFDFMSDLKFI